MKSHQKTAICVIVCAAMCTALAASLGTAGMHNGAHADPRHGASADSHGLSLTGAATPLPNHTGVAGFDLAGTVTLPDGTQPHVNKSDADGPAAGGGFLVTGHITPAKSQPHEEPAIPGDLTGDGVVGIADLFFLLDAFGNCPESDKCPADLNGDGVVDMADLLIMFNNWG
jgi:hypothetical protein